MQRSILNVEDITKLKEFPSTHNLEQILQYCLCESSEDLYNLQQLNEEAKTSAVKSLLKKITDYIDEKSESIDFKEIDSSAGDLKNCSLFKNKGYEESFKEIQKYLPPSHGSSPVAAIKTLEGNIIKHTREWKRAYSLKQKNNIHLYRALCYLYFMSLSALIANSVEIYYSDKGGDSKVTSVIYRVHPDLQKTFVMRQVAKINALFNSGRVEKFLSVSNNQEVLTEAMPILAGVALGIVSFLAILGTIRELILLFFFYRRKLAGEFKVASQYLQFSAAVSGNNKDEKKRLDLAKKFMKLSDSVNFGQKSVENISAKEALKQEESDKKFSGQEFSRSTEDNTLGQGVLL